MMADAAVPKDNSIIIQEVMANAERYNDWIYSHFAATVGNRILDVGCSIGNLTQKYVDRECVVAFEVVPASVEYIRDRFKDKSQFSVHQLGIEDPRVQTIAPHDMDTTICINVLEHVEQHDIAVRHMHEMMASGGWLNLFVPACPSIFGAMDRTDGHFRRYTKPTLRRVVEANGFKIHKLYYFNWLGYFGWWFKGRVQKKKFVDTGSVAMMEKLVPMLRALESIAHPPLGQSLVCIARKP